MYKYMYSYTTAGNSRYVSITYNRGDSMAATKKSIDSGALSGAMKTGATLNQTAAATGVSRSTVQRHVKASNGGTTFSKVREVTRNASIDKGK